MAAISYEEHYSVRLLLLKLFSCKYDRMYKPAFRLGLERVLLLLSADRTALG